MAHIACMVYLMLAACCSITIFQIFLTSESSFKVSVSFAGGGIFFRFFGTFFFYQQIVFKSLQLCSFLITPTHQKSTTLSHMIQQAHLLPNISCFLTLLLGFPRGILAPVRFRVQCSNTRFVRIKYLSCHSAECGHRRWK